jgi:hypothetical protein
VVRFTPNPDGRVKGPSLRFGFPILTPFRIFGVNSRRLRIGLICYTPDSDRRARLCECKNIRITPKMHDDNCWFEFSVAVPYSVDFRRTSVVIYLLNCNISRLTPIHYFSRPNLQRYSYLSVAAFVLTTTSMEAAIFTADLKKVTRFSLFAG